MNYTDLAKDICMDMLNYPVVDEGLYDVYTAVFKKYSKNAKDKSIILAKVIHFITLEGYDIDCIKPLKFKSYID